jgi:hypothetical protein
VNASTAMTLKKKDNIKPMVPRLVQNWTYIWCCLGRDSDFKMYAMFKCKQSEFESRADRLLLRHVYFKSNESSEFDNFDGIEVFVDNSLLFDELGQRAVILQSKFVSIRVQQFKQPPLFDELSQRASIL